MLHTAGDGPFDGRGLEPAVLLAEGGLLGAAAGADAIDEGMSGGGQVGLALGVGTATALAGLVGAPARGGTGGGLAGHVLEVVTQSLALGDLLGLAATLHTTTLRDRLRCGAGGVHGLDDYAEIADVLAGRGSGSRRSRRRRSGGRLSRRRGGGGGAALRNECHISHLLLTAVFLDLVSAGGQVVNGNHIADSGVRCPIHTSCTSGRAQNNDQLT